MSRSKLVLFINGVALLLSHFTTGTHAQVTDSSFSTYSAYLKIRHNYPETQFVDTTIPVNVKILQDVVYRIAGERPLKADIYLPRSVSPHNSPAVVIVHGGGWRSGDKTMERPLAMKLAKNGIAAVCVQYRLSAEALYPAAVVDVKMAIRWLKRHAMELSINPERIALAGASAGGQLAALAGTAKGVPRFMEKEEETNTDDEVAAIIDIDGILDFTHPAESGKDTLPSKPSAGKLWLGVSFTENPAIWVEASPLTYVSSKTPPILFINSGIERFRAGRDEFCTALKEHDIYFEVFTLNNAPHTFWLFHPWFEPCTDRIIEFLQKIFKD